MESVKTKSKKDKEGFSLAELLVAIVMSAAVTAVVMKIWGVGVEGFIENQKLRQNASKVYTVNLQIAQMIRNANEKSCESGSLWLRPNNSSSLIPLRPAEDLIIEKRFQNLAEIKVFCDSQGVLIESLFQSGSGRGLPGFYYLVWE